MKTSNILQCTLLISAFASAHWAVAADRPDPGRREFMNSCAACHGADAKGNGPLRASLQRPPSDLTSLTQKNGGVFPIQRVQQVIDGRAEIKSHGSREMPVWGERFANQGWSEYFDVAYNADAYVAARVMLLADYLNRIQVK
jgi:mono/diheme cytochrome c family protein